MDRHKWFVAMSATMVAFFVWVNPVQAALDLCCMDYPNQECCYLWACTCVGGDCRDCDAWGTGGCDNPEPCCIEETGECFSISNGCCVALGHTVVEACNPLNCPRPPGQPAEESSSIDFGGNDGAEETETSEDQATSGSVWGNPAQGGPVYECCVDDPPSCCARENNCSGCGLTTCQDCDAHMFQRDQSCGTPEPCCRGQHDCAMMAPDCCVALGYQVVSSCIACDWDPPHPSEGQDEAAEPSADNAGSGSVGVNPVQAKVGYCCLWQDPPNNCCSHVPDCNLCGLQNCRDCDAFIPENCAGIGSCCDTSTGECHGIAGSCCEALGYTHVPDCEDCEILREEPEGMTNASLAYEADEAATSQDQATSVSIWVVVVSALLLLPAVPIVMRRRARRQE